MRRTLKKMPSNPGEPNGGVSRPRPMPTLSVPWRIPWKSLSVRTRPRIRWCASMQRVNNRSKKPASPSRAHPASRSAMIMHRRATGVSNLFMICAPLEGGRHVKVTDRRTNVDCAHCLKDLVERHLPQAEKIGLMSDNFNTHKPAALSEAFPPPEARRIIEKIAWHHTPKHGSWLNRAEIELRVRQRQC